MNNVVIDTGKAIGYGWSAVKKDPWYFIGMGVIVLLLSNFGDADREPSRWSLIGFLLSIVMTCGYTTLLLSYQQGAKLPLSGLFTNVKQYWRVLGATILLGLIFVGGLLLFIIPGIYFALKYQMTINLIIDKDVGIGEAMRQSAHLTSGKKMSLFGFDLACLGVMLLGFLALGVGIFVAAPVVWLAGIFVYRQLSQSAATAT